jgi:hypothetical protein
MLERKTKRYLQQGVVQQAKFIKECIQTMLSLLQTQKDFSIKI